MTFFRIGLDSEALFLTIARGFSALFTRSPRPNSSFFHAAFHIHYSKAPMIKRRLLTTFVKLDVNVVFLKSKLSLADVSGRKCGYQ